MIQNKRKTIVGIIPARYGSSRFPGKPLAQIHGKPMILHTYQNAKKSSLLSKVIVATDNEKIRDIIKSIGGEAILSPSNLNSGTDRVAFVALNIDCDLIVNIQGDEPFINPETIDSAIIPLLSDNKINVSTLIKQIDNYEDLDNININKVVIDKDGFALYFSHTTIPFLRDFPDKKSWLINNTFYKHIGLYVYTKDFLIKFSNLPVSNLENLEKLEQLRILENGYKIKCIKTEYNNISVDTPEDLIRINNYTPEYKE